MKPIAQTIVTQVGAPIERVFEALTDPVRMVQWLPGCQAVGAAEGPLRRGGKLRVRFGAERESTFEVVDHQAPFTFGWVERGGRDGSKVFFRLDFNGGSTAITMKEVWTPPGFMAWFKGRFANKRLGRMQLDRAIQGLRQSVAMGAPGG